MLKEAIVSVYAMTPHQDVIDITMYMMTRSIQLPDQPLNNLLEGMSSKNVEGYFGVLP